LEGMSVVGNHLFAVNQSALVQDSDPADAKATRRTVRLLDYDLAGGVPRLVHEYAVPLPLYHDTKGKQLVAAQSELLAGDGQHFLLLCRDSGGGFGGKNDASAFRSVMWVDVSGASDIRGKYDGTGEAVSPKGVLRPGVVAARLTQVLDINDNTQLRRFGL